MIRRVNISWNPDRHPAMEAFWQKHRGDFSAAVRALVERNNETAAAPERPPGISQDDLAAIIEEAVARARAEWQAEMERRLQEELDRRLRSLNITPVPTIERRTDLADDELERLAAAGEASAARWRED